MSDIGVRKGNNKIRVTVIVSERNIPVNISTASTKQIFFKAPSGTVDTQTATFTSDGSDGKIYYDLLTVDLDEIGKWEVQAKVIMTSGTYTTEIVSLQVYDNLA